MCERTVFLIPSHHLGWQALRTALHEMSGIHVIGETALPDDAVEAIATLNPDVVIAAGNVGGSPVRYTLAKLRQTCCPSTRFVVFAADFEPSDVLAFADIGLVGCFLWRDLSDATLPTCL